MRARCKEKAICIAKRDSAERSLTELRLSLPCKALCLLLQCSEWDSIVVLSPAQGMQLPGHHHVLLLLHVHPRSDSHMVTSLPHVHAVLGRSRAECCPTL